MESRIQSELFSRLCPADKQLLLASLLRQKTRLRKLARRDAAVSTFVDDAVLDPDIQPIGPAVHQSAPKAILLTGATGFLGAHLLHELCVRTDATIYCLVRGRDTEEAERKLQANFAQYFGHPFDPERVRSISGDLADSDFGLPAETFAMLAREIDTIFHNGALLHHLAPYAQLKASNVTSTVAMLRLAATQRPKWLHYVSSIVAVVDRDNHGYLTEDFPRRASAELAGGYSQSKWVSEKLLAQAAERGFGVTVFRPGFITGRSDTGAWPNPNDHLVRVILGCLQMGHMPESDIVLDMTPVDFVGAAIVGIALSEPAAIPVFNVSNPNSLPWNTLVEWLQSWGYRFEVTSTAAWRERWLSHIDPGNALYPVLPLYVGGETTAGHAELLRKLVKVRRVRTVDTLSSLGMPFPIPGRELWRRYMQGFEDSGYLQIRSAARA
jgi:thioester reductase-like protein